MHSQTSRSIIPEAFLGEDPSPPYSPCATEVSEHLGWTLPEGWVRQWDTKHQRYFYVDTRTNPPYTTLIYPLGDSSSYGARETSSRNRLSYSSTSLPSKPGFADADASHHPKSETSQFPGVPTKRSAAATQSSINDQEYHLPGAFPQQEPEPEPSSTAVVSGRAARPSIPLRTRMMMHFPISLSFFRREPKWVRRLEKISDKVQRQEDKVSRRIDKWGRKCDKRLVQVQNTAVRKGLIAPTP